VDMVVLALLFLLVITEMIRNRLMIKSITLTIKDIERLEDEIEQLKDTLNS